MRLSECIAPAFWPLHRDLAEHLHTHYWLKGGRASSKSSFVAIEIILGMMRTPDANAVVYRRVADTILDSVYATLLWAIDLLGVQEFWRATKSPMQLIYKPTGQVILFRGADDPAKSKSIKFRRGYCAFLWFEELTEFRGMADVRSIMESVVRGANVRQGKKTAILYTYNPPKTSRNWTNESALAPMEDRIVHHSTYLDVPPEWLGEQTIALARDLEKHNPSAYAHEYLGEVTGTGGEVFDNLQLRAPTPEETAGADRVFCGLDFGFAVDPDSFVKWGYDRKRRRLVMLEEYEGARTPTETLAAIVKKGAGAHPVTCDSAEPRMIEELRRRGIAAHAAKKGPDSIEHGMRWLQELSAIIIDPETCPKAAQTFSAYEYAQDKNGDFLPAYPDRDNHSIDATRYALETVSAMRQAKTIKRGELGL